MKIDKIVILGMGGSGIGGDLVRALIQNECEIPIYIHRDYGVPAFVDQKTLVLAVSCSGNTEEVLDGFVKAVNVGAKLVAITAGEELERLAKKYRTPFYKFDYHSQPRGALGFMFGGILGVLKKLDILTDIGQKDIDEATKLLADWIEKLKPENKFKKNLAKKIAQKIVNSVPVIWGAGILEPVARRWKTQINENAKTECYFEALPESNHNSISGLDFPKTKDLFVIILQSKFDHPRIRNRIEISRDILDQKEVPHELVLIEPTGGVLSDQLCYILVGDFVSYYLAILKGQGPEPLEVVEYLKGRLEK